jgi:hypothetical protein
LFSYNKTNKQAHQTSHMLTSNLVFIYFAFGWLSTFTMGLFQWKKGLKKHGKLHCWTISSIIILIVYESWIMYINLFTWDQQALHPRSFRKIHGFVDMTSLRWANFVWNENLKGFLKKNKKKEKNPHSENWKNDDVMLKKGQ